MAPLNPNNTRRYFLNYSTAVANHTMMLRTTESVTNSNISAIMAGIFAIWSDQLTTVSILSLEMAAKGTNVRNPVTWTENLSFGTGTELGDRGPRQLCFLGRSTDGRRARFFLFGWTAATPADWRLTGADNARVTSTYNLLIANPGVFLSISELATVKYNYADVNFNSYWERTLRS